MERKPIKRNENLVPISREHHATLLFCWKLRQGVKKEISVDRMARYIQWFYDDHMLAHFRTEEQYLFTDHSDPKILKGLKDHQDILSQVNHILSSGRGDYENILHLADTVDKHTRYEERELFPYLEKKFNQNELTKIGLDLHREEHTAKEEYDDEFWSTKK